MDDANMNRALSLAFLVKDGGTLSWVPSERERTLATALLSSRDLLIAAVHSLRSYQDEDTGNAVNVVRTSLDTILAIARSDGYNAIREIIMTAEVGIARVKRIFPSKEVEGEDTTPCEYFRSKECFAGCPLVACKEAGECQKPNI